MKEGAQRVMEVYGLDKKRQYKGMKDGYTTPDTVGNFAAAQGNIVEHARKKAKLTAHNMIAANFSMDCTPETIIHCLEAQNGRGRGSWAGKKREEEQDNTLQKMLEGITKYAAQVPAWSWTVEQPTTSAMIRVPGMEETLGAPVRVNINAPERNRDLEARKKKSAKLSESSIYTHM